MYFSNKLYCWFKYDLGQENYALQVRPNRVSNSWPLDHDSTFYVTEMPALTTWPSVTSYTQTHHLYCTPVFLGSHIRMCDVLGVLIKSAPMLMGAWLTWKLQEQGHSITQMEYHIEYCACEPTTKVHTCTQRFKAAIHNVYNPHSS